MNPQVIDVIISALDTEVIISALDKYKGNAELIQEAKQWVTSFKTGLTQKEVDELLNDDGEEWSVEETLAFLEANPTTPEELEELKEAIAKSEEEERLGIGYTSEEVRREMHDYIDSLYRLP
jgi:hypothetical protein